MELVAEPFPKRLHTCRYTLAKESGAAGYCILKKALKNPDKWLANTTSSILKVSTVRIVHLSEVGHFHWVCGKGSSNFFCGGKNGTAIRKREVHLQGGVEMTSEDIKSLVLRAKQYVGRNLNEAQTKTALVQPFIEALGYQVSDPFEVVAEFTADQGIKRGEKIDYAVICDDAPILLIECKPAGDVLSEGACSQLRRYFQAVPEAKVGILTNGTRYLFFSDRERDNIMDDKPFMEIDLLSFNEQLFPELQRISKETLDIDGLLRSADGLQIFREFMREFSAEMENPSDDLVRFFVAKFYDGRLTAKAMEFFSPIFPQVVAGYLDERLNQRLEFSKKAPEAVRALADEKDSGAVTTNTETWGLVILRTLLHQIVDASRINMRDAKSYCAILLDDNNRKTICRFYNFCEWKNGDPNIGDNAHVIIFTGKPGGERFPVRFVDDLYPLKEQFVAAVKSFL